MIVGIGTDLVSIRRIEKAFMRRPAAFVHRILTATERDVFHHRWGQSHARAMNYLATRFAAKEACVKAMATLHPVHSWQKMEITNTLAGAAQLNWRGESEHAQDLVFHLSVSDEFEYAQAMVVVARGLPNGKPIGHQDLTRTQAETPTQPLINPLINPITQQMAAKIVRERSAVITP